MTLHSNLLLEWVKTERERVWYKKKERKGNKNILR